MAIGRGVGGNTIILFGRLSGKKARHVIIACFLSHFHALDFQTDGGFALAKIKQLMSEPLWEKTSADKCLSPSQA